MRKGNFLLLGQDPVVILGHRTFCQRTVFIAPGGEQFIQTFGINNRTGENMRADFGAFLQDAHREVLACLVGQLLESDSGAETRGATPHYHQVIRH